MRNRAWIRAKGRAGFKGEVGELKDSRGQVAGQVPRTFDLDDMSQKIGTSRMTERSSANVMKVSKPRNGSTPKQESRTRP